MFSTRLNHRLFWMTATFLLIALSRFLLLPALSFDQDEVWSVWMTFGTVPEIIGRTDTNWSAWSNLIMYAWRILMGYHPFALRIFPILLFMLSFALSYQLGRKLFKSHEAAFLSSLAYASLGYIDFLSVYLRPYAMIMPLLPLGLILVIRYFEKPGFKRALALGLHMAFMFYISIMSIFPFLVFGGFSLFLYGRKIWRWWLVGLIAALAALPEILNKSQLIFERTSISFETVMPPFPQAVFGMFGDYFGPAFVLWLILIGIALIGILRFARQYHWFFLWLLIWAVLGTCILYWIHPRTGLFRPRYAWWIALAIALWTGYGLAQLPRWGRWASAILLLGLSFIVSPDAIAAYKEPIPDVESLFEWFESHYEAGDVLVIDPNTKMSSSDFRTEVWDYYTRVYFNNGLHTIDSPNATQSRVWYLHSEQSTTEALEQSVKANRLESIFYGSSGFQIQLYEGAPDPEGILFTNGLRFHGVQILDGEGLATMPLAVPEGGQLRLRLWWSVDAPLSQEYSVGIKVMSDAWEGIYAQQDGAPHAIYILPIFNEMLEPIGDMTTWQTGQYYVEDRIVELPYAPRLRRTEFTVYMTVYQWQDGLRIPAEGTNEEDLLPLFDFTAMAW